MFVIFDKKSDYTAQISSIEARDIVFIKDTKEVITHGVAFTDQKTVDDTIAEIQTALAGKLSSVTAGDGSIAIAGSGITRSVAVRPKSGGGLAKDTNGLYVDTDVIASKSSVDALGSNLTNLENNTYRKDQTYTQKEVNDRIATVSGSVYRVAGSVDNFSDLPKASDATIGDVYNIVNAFTFEGKPYPAGTNVVLASHLEGGQTLVDWDPLGGTVDLSGYVPISRKVNGSPLSADVTLTGASLKLTGYTVASTYSAVAATDTINVAIGKLQKAANDYKVSADVIKAYTINGKEISTNPTLIGSDLLLTEFTVPTTYSAVVATGSVNTAFGKMQKFANNVGDYKINSKPINTSPTLNGADIKLTGYIAVTGGKLAATDTINAAMNKLDTAVTALDWEVITAS